MYDPIIYDAWYSKGHGKWIADVEYLLIKKLLKPINGESVLDVGCGTGYFSRQFKQSGLHVTGLELDSSMLDFACISDKQINWIRSNAQYLPFKNNSVDYVTAITSLCFVEQPTLALSEMLRVAKQTVLLGLLNKNSLLYWNKRNKGMYAGARWDTCSSVKQWLESLNVKIKYKICRSSIFIPTGGLVAKKLESIIPTRILYGGFLVVKIEKE